MEAGHTPKRIIFHSLPTLHIVLHLCPVPSQWWRIWVLMECKLKCFLCRELQKQLNLTVILILSIPQIQPKAKASLLSSLPCEPPSINSLVRKAIQLLIRLLYVLFLLLWQMGFVPNERYPPRPPCQPAKTTLPFWTCPSWIKHSRTGT